MPGIHNKNLFLALNESDNRYTADDSRTEERNSSLKPSSTQQKSSNSPSISVKSKFFIESKAGNSSKIASTSLDMKDHNYSIQNLSIKQKTPPDIFKYNAVVDKIKPVQNSFQFSINDWRLKLKKYGNTSTFGTVYEKLFVIISFICAIALDWLINLFLADIKFHYLMSFDSVVDKSIIIPFILIKSLNLSLPDVHKRYDHFEQFLLYILYAMKSIRILRLIQIRKLFTSINDSIHRFLADTGLWILSIILFNASLIQFLEYDNQPYEFHTWIYYTVVTFATVGYGDITPVSTLGRLYIMIMICLAIIAVPSLSQQLVDMLNMQSVWTRAVYLPKSRSEKHVVICGDIKTVSLTEFFEELFHEDHEAAHDLHAVILISQPPSLEIIQLMRSPKYFLSITFLQGSPLIESDLKRACAESASAVMIMSNKFSSTPDEEDSKVILLSSSIKRYISNSINNNKLNNRHSNNNNNTSINLGNTNEEILGNTLFCLQLIKPENRRHLQISDFQSDNTKFIHNSDTTPVVCLNEIKMGVLAKATLFQGANTLIMNLIVSFSNSTDEKDEILDENDENSDLTTLGDASSAWIREYEKGCAWEIYTTELAEIFCGATFCELSYALYEKLGVLLFALQIYDEDNQGHPPKLLLNPASLVIPPKNGRYIIEAFVIAKNKASSNLSTNIDNRDRQNIFRSRSFAIVSNNHMDKDSRNFHLRKATLSSSRSTIKIPIFRNTSKNPSHFKNQNNDDELNQTQSQDNHDKNKGNNNDNTALNTPSKSTKRRPSVLPSVLLNRGARSLPNVNKTQSRAKKLWKSLSRSSLAKRKVLTYNHQEIVTQLEDQHLTNTYFVREHPADLDDVIIKTSVVNEIPFINNHCIIIGKDLANLYDLIKPLRAKYLGSCRFIVILYPYDIPYDVWQRISIFDCMVVVRGSPLEESNLKRAGIFRASDVIILADGSISDVDENKTIEKNTLRDTEGIFVYQCIKRMNPGINIVMEIINQSNIPYLDSATADSFGYSLSSSDYKFSQPYASGALFNTSLLDSLICQAYYNPQIIKVMHKLISGFDQIDRFEIHQQATKQAILEDQEASSAAANSEPSSSFLKKILTLNKSGSQNSLSTSNVSFQPAKSQSSLLSPNKNNNANSHNNSPKNLNSDNNNNANDNYNQNELNLVGSNMYQISIPQEFFNDEDDSDITANNDKNITKSSKSNAKVINKRYSELFRYLTKQKMIPLGLLRGVIPSIGMGLKANKSPYVYTNPHKNSIVYECDKVFVLSIKPIQSQGPVNVKDWLLDIQKQKLWDGSSGSKRESISLAGGTSKNIRQWDSIEKAHQKLEDRISILSAEMNKKINMIVNTLNSLKDNNQTNGNNNINSNTNDNNGYQSTSQPISPSNNTISSNEEIINKHNSKAILIKQNSPKYIESIDEKSSSDSDESNHSNDKSKNFNDIQYSNNYKIEQLDLQEEHKIDPHNDNINNNNNNNNSKNNNNNNNNNNGPIIYKNSIEILSSSDSENHIENSQQDLQINPASSYYDPNESFNENDFQSSILEYFPTSIDSIINDDEDDFKNSEMLNNNNNNNIDHNYYYNNQSNNRQRPMSSPHHEKEDNNNININNNKNDRNKRPQSAIPDRILIKGPSIASLDSFRVQSADNRKRLKNKTNYRI
eukprot:gene6416-8833_t